MSGNGMGELVGSSSSCSESLSISESEYRTASSRSMLKSGFWIGLLADAAADIAGGNAELLSEDKVVWDKAADAISALAESDSDCFRFDKRV